MTDRLSTLPVDDSVHELIVGNSFSSMSADKFHCLRYDFKPASIDPSQPSSMEVADSGQVTYTVQNVEGSGQQTTVYKGGKRPATKECVLLINHDTGEFRLERLSSTIHLKRTRDQQSLAKTPVLGSRKTPIEESHDNTASLSAASAPKVAKKAQQDDAEYSTYSTPQVKFPKSEQSNTTTAVGKSSRSKVNLSSIDLDSNSKNTPKLRLDTSADTGFAEHGVSKSSSKQDKQYGKDRPQVVEERPARADTSDKTEQGLNASESMYYTALSHDLQLSESSSDSD